MPEQKHANIGMNDVVSIKPTEAGWKQIVSNVDRINERIRRNPRCLTRISIPASDTDGYISGPFWHLMQMFDWPECVNNCDVFFSDMRIIIPPETHQEAAVSDKGKYPEELRELIGMAQRQVKFLSNPSTIVNVKRARYAVNEIRRLRARVNKLIKMINDGDTYGDHSYSEKDLIEEGEI